MSPHQKKLEPEKEGDRDRRECGGREIVGHDPEAPLEFTVEEADGPRLEDIEKPERKEEGGQREGPERNHEGGGEESRDFIPDHLRRVGTTQTAGGVRTQGNAHKHGQRSDHRAGRKAKRPFGHAHADGEKAPPGARRPRQKTETEPCRGQGPDVHPSAVHGALRA